MLEQKPAGGVTMSDLSTSCFPFPNPLTVTNILLGIIILLLLIIIAILIIC